MVSTEVTKRLSWRLYAVAFVPFHFAFTSTMLFSSRSGIEEHFIAIR